MYAHVCMIEWSFVCRLMFLSLLLYVVLCVCVCTFSKHRATTLRSNLQQFNRPGKDLHIEFYVATGINCWSFMWEGITYISAL